MVSPLIVQLGIPVLSAILKSALGSIDDPLTRTAVEALEGVDKAIERGKISNAQVVEANRHAEKMAEIQLKESTSKLKEINESFRAEVSSGDIYVRRMRPTFGYVMAVTWLAQMMAVAYVIVFDTQNAGFVLSAISSLSAIWAVGLSVLGIYVYKRSEDKKLLGNDMIFWNKQK